jgi:predicted membrane chloride channel (bestrophin family)
MVSYDPKDWLFGGDENDLPLGKIAHNIRVHIGELI